MVLMEVAVSSRRSLTQSAALVDSPASPSAPAKGLFEASPIPRGENQFDTEPGADERAEPAIPVDHVATCGWPHLSPCPRCFPPAFLAEGP